MDPLPWTNRGYVSDDEVEAATKQGKEEKTKEREGEEDDGKSEPDPVLVHS